MAFMVMDNATLINMEIIKYCSLGEIKLTVLQLCPSLYNN